MPSCRCRLVDTSKRHLSFIDSTFNWYYRLLSNNTLPTVAEEDDAKGAGQVAHKQGWQDQGVLGGQEKGRAHQAENKVRLPCPPPRLRVGHCASVALPMSLISSHLFGHLGSNNNNKMPNSCNTTHSSLFLFRFRRDPKGTKVLHQSIEQKAAAKAMRNEGAKFRIGDLNTKAQSRLDEEEKEMARKKEKRRTAVDGAVASLEHAISGNRMKI